MKCIFNNKYSIAFLFISLIYISHSLSISPISKDINIIENRSNINITSSIPLLNNNLEDLELLKLTSLVNRNKQQNKILSTIFRESNDYITRTMENNSKLLKINAELEKVKNLSFILDRELEDKLINSNKKINENSNEDEIDEEYFIMSLYNKSRQLIGKFLTKDINIDSGRVEVVDIKELFYNNSNSSNKSSNKHINYSFLDLYDYNNEELDVIYFSAYIKGSYLCSLYNINYKNSIKNILSKFKTSFSLIFSTNTQIKSYVGSNIIIDNTDNAKNTINFNQEYKTKTYNVSHNSVTAFSLLVKYNSKEVLSLKTKISLKNIENNFNNKYISYYTDKKSIDNLCFDPKSLLLSSKKISSNTNNHIGDIFGISDINIKDDFSMTEDNDIILKHSFVSDTKAKLITNVWLVCNNSNADLNFFSTLKKQNNSLVEYDKIRSSLYNYSLILEKRDITSLKNTPILKDAKINIFEYDKYKNSNKRKEFSQSKICNNNNNKKIVLYLNFSTSHFKRNFNSKNIDNYISSSQDIASLIENSLSSRKGILNNSIVVKTLLDYNYNNTDNADNTNNINNISIINDYISLIKTSNSTFKIVVDDSKITDNIFEIKITRDNQDNVVIYFLNINSNICLEERNTSTMKNQVFELKNKNIQQMIQKFTETIRAKKNNAFLNLSFIETNNQVKMLSHDVLQKLEQGLDLVADKLVSESNKIEQVEK